MESRTKNLFWAVLGGFVLTWLMFWGTTSSLTRKVEKLRDGNRAAVESLQIIRDDLQHKADLTKELLSVFNSISDDMGRHGDRIRALESYDVELKAKLKGLDRADDVVINTNKEVKTALADFEKMFEAFELQCKQREQEVEEKQQDEFTVKEKEEGKGLKFWKW